MIRYEDYGRKPETHGIPWPEQSGFGVMRALLARMLAIVKGAEASPKAAK